MMSTRMEFVTLRYFIDYTDFFLYIYRPRKGFTLSAIILNSPIDGHDCMCSDKNDFKTLNISEMMLMIDDRRARKRCSFAWLQLRKPQAENDKGLISSVQCCHLCASI
jgi:hypothetical protein